MFNTFMQHKTGLLIYIYISTQHDCVCFFRKKTYRRNCLYFNAGITQGYIYVTTSFSGNIEIKTGKKKEKKGYSNS